MLKLVLCYTGIKEIYPTGAEIMESLDVNILGKPNNVVTTFFNSK